MSNLIPEAMNRTQLAAVLRDMATRVEAGDSFEGNLEYLIAGPRRTSRLAGRRRRVLGDRRVPDREPAGSGRNENDRDGADVTRPGEAEAIKAATGRLLDNRYGWNRPHAGVLEALHNEAANHDARIAVAAAYSLIFTEGVKAGREQAAQEIEAQANNAAAEKPWFAGMDDAADIARGSS